MAWNECHAYQEAAPRLGADRIVKGELTAVEFPPGHFDVITFWDVLEHLSKNR